MLKKEKLPRNIGVYSAAMQNLGANIGAGIFLVQGIMIGDVGSAGLVILLFLLGSVISIFGTWAYVELGCMFPVSGGPKEYLSAAFKNPKTFIGFVFSHTWIWLMIPGQVAAVAVGTGTYFLAACFGSQSHVQTNGPAFVFNNYDYLIRGIAGIAVVIMTIIHGIAPKLGIRIQDVLSSIKSLVLFLIIIVGVLAACGAFKVKLATNYQHLFKNSIWDVNNIVNSFFKVLFVYDGWATINYSLSELKEPKKNLPKAAFGAAITATLLYMGATLSYFIVVPVEDLTSTNQIIALQFFEKTLGYAVGAKLMPLMISLAAFSCAMTLCFANSRLIFETSNDGMLYPSKIFGKVSRYQTPLNALILNAIISLVFIYAPPPGVAGIFVLRKTNPPSLYQSPLIGNVFFIVSCILLAVMPFVPPKSPSSVPYYLIPVVGICFIITLCIIWYFCRGYISIEMEDQELLRLESQSELDHMEVEPTVDRVTQDQAQDSMEGQALYPTQDSMESQALDPTQDSMECQALDPAQEQDPAQGTSEGQDQDPKSRSTTQG